MEVGGCRAAAQAMTLRQLITADALLLRSIEVGVLLKTGLACRRKECINERMPRSPVANGERSERTMELVLSAFIRFRPDIVRQNVAVASARRPVRCPFVIVAAMSADVDHCVH